MCVIVKGVNFFGPKSEYIVSGSDCGNIYFWDKNTEAIVQWMRGDEDGVVSLIFKKIFTLKYIAHCTWVCIIKFGILIDSVS